MIHVFTDCEDPVKVNGVEFDKMENGYAVYNVKSGEYKFEVKE